MIPASPLSPSPMRTFRAFVMRLGGLFAGNRRNRELAEETVAQALRAEHDKIARWEERGYRRPNLALHFDAGRVIGRSMRQHGDESSSPATEAVIVLKADGPNSFYVLTSYPEDRR